MFSCRLLARSVMPRSHRAFSPVFRVTSSGRCDGHQKFEQSTKSACQGSAIFSVRKPAG